MNVFPYVAAFATLCFVWSYGIQKRRWWAWYAGWIFGALVAAAIAFLTWAGLFAPSLKQQLVNMLFPGGATLVWIFWVTWWARNRGEFIPRNNKPRDGAKPPP